MLIEKKDPHSIVEVYGYEIMERIGKVLKTPVHGPFSTIKYLPKLDR